MKRLFCILLLLLLFSFSVSAEENPYKEQYRASGMEEVEDKIGESARDFFSFFDIEPENPDWVNKITAEGIFEQIAEFLKEGGRGPLKAAVYMTATVVIYAAAILFDRLSKYQTVLSYIFMLSTASGALLPMFSLVSSTTECLKGTATLMTSFVPIYSGILTVSGRGLTASGMGFLLLFAAEGVNLVASFVVLPLMGCYLAMGLTGGLMQSGGALSLGEAVKKASTWLFSLVLTVFLGLLSVQTAVNASADSAGLKTVKFVLGSLVPVTGGALSESLTTLTSSMKLLSSSAAMYVVVALGITALPIVLELLLWRLALFSVTAVAELFGVKEGVSLFKCADHVLSMLLGIILFAGSLFIISLAVITGSG